MLDHKGTVFLETDRLILRRFGGNDTEMMFTNWANDPLVAKYLTWKAHTNVAETKSVIDMWISKYPQPNFYQWAMFSKETNNLIGSISVIHMEEKIRACEIGYCIGQAFWNKGYTTEAGKKVIEFLFNEVGFNRIEARHDIENNASGKVMMKLGMQYEGVLRQDGFNNEGKIIDLVVYSIIKGI